MADAETFDKRLILIIYSNKLMLNPRVLLTLAFKKMLYDNSREMSNPVPPASSGVAIDSDSWGGLSWCHPFNV